MIVFGSFFASQIKCQPFCKRLILGYGDVRLLMERNVRSEIIEVRRSDLTAIQFLCFTCSDKCSASSTFSLESRKRPTNIFSSFFLFRKSMGIRCIICLQVFSTHYSCCKSWDSVSQKHYLFRVVRFWITCIPLGRYKLSTSWVLFQASN